MRRCNPWSVAIILACVLAFFPLRGFPQAPTLKTNLLAIKERATSQTLDIEVQPLVELNFKTKAEVLELRTDAIDRYPELIVGKYRPSDLVFGQIVDKLPWWGVLGAFHYGPGKQSIAGPALHSKSIVNPYLLVLPEFHMQWDRSTVEEIDKQNWHMPLYCSARRLRWDPPVGRAEAIYEAECLLKNRIRFFSLVAFNARDLNLNFIHVSYRDSQNILKKDAPTTPYRNPQFIHKGGSCGYPGGCNNMSPATPPIDSIQITKLPAKVVIHLWERNPGTVDTAQDMEYVMHFER